MAVAYHNRHKFNVIEAFFKGNKLNRLYVGKELSPWKLKDESGGGGVLSYYGQATGLKGARMQLAGASVGNYALFAGGYPITDTVNVYQVA